MKLSTLIARNKEKGTSKNDTLLKAKAAVKKAGKKWTTKIADFFDTEWRKKVKPTVETKLPKKVSVRTAAPIKLQRSLINVKVSVDTLVKYLKGSKILNLLSGLEKQIVNLSGGPTAPVILSLKATGAKSSDGCILTVQLKSAAGGDSITLEREPGATISVWKHIDGIGDGALTSKTENKLISDNKAVSLVKDLISNAGGKGIDKPIKGEAVQYKILQDVKQDIAKCFPYFRGKTILSAGDDVSLEEIQKFLANSGWTYYGKGKVDLDGTQAFEVRYSKDYDDRTAFIAVATRKIHYIKGTLEQRLQGHAKSEVIQNFDFYEEIEKWLKKHPNLAKKFFKYKSIRLVRQAFTPDMTDVQKKQMEKEYSETKTKVMDAVKNLARDIGIPDKRVDHALFDSIMSDGLWGIHEGKTPKDLIAEEIKGIPEMIPDPKDKSPYKGITIRVIPKDYRKIK